MLANVLIFSYKEVYQTVLKNIKSHIPKIILAWESGVIDRIIYYKKEMNFKISEARELINNSNKHNEILILKNKLNNLEKEIFLTISKYE